MALPPNGDDGDDRGEFAFIERLAARVPPLGAGQVGVGDDAAVLADRTLAAVDTLVADRHFRLDWTDPESVGWKALVVNLSDIAAMGGMPTAALAAVTLPPDPPGLADSLLTGLLEASRTFGCPLVGGDTTAGDQLVISVTVLGRMPTETAPVLRTGARPGDGVFVTGALGAAAMALETLTAGTAPDTAHAEVLHRPVPRLAQGAAAAAGGATAMIDLSDGLAADLGHILDASGVGVEVEGAAIPLATGVTLDLAIGGGDDYELCFTAPDDALLFEAFGAAGVDRPCRIGTIVAEGRSLVRDGTPEPLGNAGWSHPIP